MPIVDARSIFSSHSIPFCHLNDPVMPISELRPHGLYDYNVVIKTIVEAKSMAAFGKFLDRVNCRFKPCCHISDTKIQAASLRARVSIGLGNHWS